MKDFYDVFAGIVPAVLAAWAFAAHMAFNWPLWLSFALSGAWAAGILLLVLKEALRNRRRNRSSRAV